MPTTAQMDKAVDLLEGQIGYDESRCSATVGNNTRFGVWYGMNCAAWCAMAVSWAYYTAGFPQPASTAKGFAYTPSGAAWYQGRKAWAGPTTDPERGWVVFFYSVSAGRICHVGLVRGPRGADGLVPTVEGNTDSAGSASGGSVMGKRRSSNQGISFRIAGYGRPDLLAGAQQEEEWWMADIPAANLAQIQKQAEEALMSQAGQAAIIKAVKEVYSWRPDAVSEGHKALTTTELLGIYTSAGVPAIMRNQAAGLANQAAARAALDALSVTPGGETAPLTPEQVTDLANAISDSLKGSLAPDIIRALAQALAS